MLNNFSIRQSWNNIGSSVPYSSGFSRAFRLLMNLLSLAYCIHSYIYMFVSVIFVIYQLKCSVWWCNFTFLIFIPFYSFLHVHHIISVPMVVSYVKLFLAAMSSSRSDIVTQSVRLSVRVSICPLFFLLVSLKFLQVLKSFNGVIRMFKEYLKFKGSFKDVSRKF